VLPFGLAIIAFDMWHNWLWLLFFVACAMAGVLLTKLIHFRPRPRSTPTTVRDVVEDIRSSPTPIDLEMEDAKYEGTGWRMLEVRKGWARLAVTLDAMWVLLVGIICTRMFADYEGAAAISAETPVSAGGWIGIPAGLAMMGFTAYAHKKATQPRKPKRAWLPAFLRTNV
jgi:hypothetical protein